MHVHQTMYVMTRNFFGNQEFTLKMRCTFLQKFYMNFTQGTEASYDTDD